MTYYIAGRRTPPARSDHAVRAARQVRDVGASAGRRVRDDHAVEFPDGDPVVEDHSGAGLRQHRRHQTGGATPLSAINFVKVLEEAGVPPASSIW